ncbi:MAG: hypothetical protein JW765_05990 [Deltaproteobacteria bacterium]|nr:hypothetical protein [Candidatus Zymogenaceae bacterium]
MKIKTVCGLFLFMGILAAALVAPTGPAASLPGLPSLQLGPAPCIAAEGGTEVVEHYTGYLLSRMERIGTRSEGPEYYLRLKDGSEIHVVKKADLWKEDPALQKYVDRKVWIGGSLVDGELYYTEIKRLYG